nr:ABC transporter transmembrane domain-containing protein [Bacillus subtilis]
MKSRLTGLKCGGTLSYVKPYRKTILPLSFLTVLIGTAVKLVIPILIGVYVLDQAITGRNPEPLIQLIFIISGLYVLNYAANVLRIRWMNQLGTSMSFTICDSIYLPMCGAYPIDFLISGRRVRSLVRIMNDINSLQELFTSGVINLLTDLSLLVTA